MNIYISEAAKHWFKEEVGLESGGKVRFFSKIYGSSKVQESHSLAFMVDADDDKSVASITEDGVTYYINEADLWFFDGHDLYIEYDEKLDEVAYDYKK
ncbi:HesB/YadR/YfhF family protein [Macrococcus armenti]|uniref:HesB/YadR/YfhF family protein n=1 Tax=Macrococcus armenti TaxID=2875764 RepID=UPI001CC9ED97|nr:HesB/YadR/YfhF family protein [Macrococcus armenti]UBH08676.1 HesB/YadR/YfhF family protein [Macrococcus armenti]UBH10975.1 HesB/YadR/YfhF family protein [Macrococcus armenti]UBH15449.1 HesB/YadR/YfhF family protein [Macrococcus armenti]UBH17809.1 HesB/YadR/YfhF family protein [Macrococcus armenti]UBH20074.1 HesB/YadR/YfhF family protein [Macrococcus armenti]